MLEERPIKQQKIRLSYLDGMRGLAALAVVICHIVAYTGIGMIRPNNAVIRIMQDVMRQGGFSVSIFIALSGFCLAIPIVRGNLWFRNGFVSYIKRRARRILVPYYAALFFSLLLILFIPILHTYSHTSWDNRLPVTLGSIVSHIFLVHNFDIAWIVKINGPMWSVATEWQIYFLLPLFLLLWKRTNLFVSFVCFFLIGIMLTRFRLFQYAHTQYIGIFFMGVLSAYFSFRRNLEKLRKQTCLVVFSIFIMMIVMYVNFLNIEHITDVVTETLFGFGFSLFLYYLTNLSFHNQKSKMINFLSHKLIVKLGDFSYSLYLTHFPILALTNFFAMYQLKLSYNYNFIFMWIVGLPLSLLVAYVFYLLVERFFKNA